MRHVILRCTAATSSDEVCITVLDATYWITNTWKLVTQSTICNTFRVADSICSDNQETTNDTTNSNNDFNQPIITDDVFADLQVLKSLLNHINIGGQYCNDK